MMWDLEEGKEAEVIQRVLPAVSDPEYVDSHAYVTMLCTNVRLNSPVQISPMAARLHTSMAHIRWLLLHRHLQSDV